MSTRQLMVLLPFVAVALAAHGQQVCPAGNVLATPDSSLVDNGNGTVSDTATGLMWKQCSEGTGGSACTGAPTLLHWLEAQGAALSNNVENFAGHADWRLPNVKELNSIIETGCAGPSINQTRFPGTPSDEYWTSTTDASGVTKAWVIGFDAGFPSPALKTTGNKVRLVRGGLSLGAFDGVAGHCTLDVDGNGTQDAFTDGLLVLRALFGLTGTSVTNGAIGGGSPTRTKWADIRAYLNGSCGTNLNP